MSRSLARPRLTSSNPRRRVTLKMLRRHLRNTINRRTRINVVVRYVLVRTLRRLVRDLNNRSLRRNVNLALLTRAVSSVLTFLRLLGRVSSSVLVVLRINVSACRHVTVVCDHLRSYPRHVLVSPIVEWLSTICVPILLNDVKGRLPNAIAAAVIGGRRLHINVYFCLSILSRVTGRLRNLQRCHFLIVTEGRCRCLRRFSFFHH